MLRASCLFLSFFFSLKSHTSLSKHYFLKLSAVGLFPGKKGAPSPLAMEPFQHPASQGTRPRALRPQRSLGLTQDRAPAPGASCKFNSTHLPPISAGEEGEGRAGKEQGSGTWAPLPACRAHPGEEQDLGLRTTSRDPVHSCPGPSATSGASLAKRPI